MRLPRRLQHGESAELVEHLGELRGCLIVCLLAISVAFAVTYTFHGHLLNWLNAPLGHRRPYAFDVTEPFLTTFKISAYAAVALALPVLLWQLWAFLAPALSPQARRSLSGFVVFATALFAIGVGFGYRIALPAAVHYLTTYDNHQYRIEVRASSYYSFVLLVLLAVGIVFELPIFILGLVRLNILSSSTLRKKRRLGYVIVAAVAVALPGVDPVTTTLEMVPMMLLFEASIWLSVLFERRWQLTPQSPEPQSAP